MVKDVSVLGLNPGFNHLTSINRIQEKKDRMPVARPPSNVLTFFFHQGQKTKKRREMKLFSNLKVGPIFSYLF